MAKMILKKAPPKKKKQNTIWFITIGAIVAVVAVMLATIVISQLKLEVSRETAVTQK